MVVDKVVNMEHNEMQMNNCFSNQHDMMQTYIQTDILDDISNNTIQNLKRIINNNQDNSYKGYMLGPCREISSECTNDELSIKHSNVITFSSLLVNEDNRDLWEHDLKIQ